MKTELLSVDGKKVKEIELPSVFSTRLREDIIKKVFEAEKKIQPYGPHYMAGRRHSASGRIRHIRHKWRTAYGRGISRIPRKTMWRRGTQFYWIGAEISSARGGRRAHPPRIEEMMSQKKINKKEHVLAVKSVIASTSNNELFKKRYQRLVDVKGMKMPIVVESKLAELKSKPLIESVNKILGDLAVVAKREKAVRAGKGKSRNRKYKESQGVLIITGNKEDVQTSLFDSRKISEVEVKDLYPLGRITIFTENAIKDLEAAK